MAKSQWDPRKEITEGRQPGRKRCFVVVPKMQGKMDRIMERRKERRRSGDWKRKKRKRKRKRKKKKEKRKKKKRKKRKKNSLFLRPLAGLLCALWGVPFLLFLGLCFALCLCLAGFCFHLCGGFLQHDKVERSEISQQQCQG